MSFAFLFAGCANKPLTTIKNFERYQSQLAAEVDWQVRGRINVRTPDDSDTVSVTWKNTNKDYTIRLSGTLGIGTTRIQGNDKWVTLERGGEEPAVYRSAEELVYVELGREIPINDLHYWVRGLTAPQPKPTQLDLSEAGNLATLQQAGWSLTYSEYTAVGRWNMPRKIIAERDDFVLTLYGLRWEFGQG